MDEKPGRKTMKIQFIVLRNEHIFCVRVCVCVCVCVCARARACEKKTKKEEQTTKVLLDLKSVATLFWFSIYLIETKGQQNGRLLSTQPSLQLKLVGRGSDTMKYGPISLDGICIGK